MMAASESRNVKRGRSFLPKELRIPRTYRFAANILRDAEMKKGSLKNLIYSMQKCRDLKKLYALTYETLKYKNIINQLVTQTELFKREKKLNKHLGLVLIYDLLFGKKSLPGNSAPVQVVSSYKKELSKALKKLLKNSSVHRAEELISNEMTNRVLLPRYARINTIQTTTQNVITKLKGSGYSQYHYSKDIDLDEYYDILKNLQKNQFVEDIHFPDLLVFAHGIDFSENILYKEGHLILEDKASYIAATVLHPPENSVVLDGCAAPGIKTAHLAAIMNNKGKLLASDIDQKRINSLKEIIDFSGVTCCKVTCVDFTSINPQKEPFSDVEYILLDPSCSGSGLVSRLDYLVDSEDTKSVQRINKLCSFQVALLKHALSFPNVKRIVYSTCSIYIEENERVIEEALVNWMETYKVVKTFPEWPVRGEDSYDFGPLCIRADPKRTHTNGFFIAVIERKGIKLQKKEIKMQKNKPQSITEKENISTISDEPKTKKKKKIQEDKEESVTKIENSNSATISNKRKMKKKKKIQDDKQESGTEIEINNFAISAEPKKKKKKIQGHKQESEINNSTISNKLEMIKKKKKTKATSISF